jgi:NTE family protein
MNFAPSSGGLETRFGLCESFLSSPAPTRQIIPLVFFSPSLPNRLISERLAGSLRAETGASVVLVRLEALNGAPVHFPGRDGRATAVDWAPSEMVLQGQFAMPSNLIKAEAGFHVLTLNLSGGFLAPGSNTSLIDYLSRQFRYVLIEVIVDVIERAALLEFLRQEDLGYLFLRPTTDRIYQLEKLWQELEPKSKHCKLALKPILCLADGEEMNACDRVIQRVTGPVHMFVHGCPSATEPPPQSSEAFNKDLRRVAREIGGKLVGLALSSGAAKGFAHIGVIQVLEEHGIEVDVVAGASIGAYIGALWAFGFKGTQIEELARELEGRWGFWSLIDPTFPPRRGFLRGLALKKRLMRSIGQASFADLERPLRIVVGNLATLDRTALTSGHVASAVHASMAVPGICVPVTLDGEAFIDGGIVDPMPVEVLREMGVDRVIAVNAIPTPDRIRSAILAERELARQNGSRLRKLFRRAFPIDEQLNYFARGNLFEIVMRSVHGAQVRLAEASCRLADVVLRPDICDDRWLDCRNPRRFINLGRESAEKKLEEIRALIGRSSNDHEHELAKETVAAVA